MKKKVTLVILSHQRQIIQTILTKSPNQWTQFSKSHGIYHKPQSCSILNEQQWHLAWQYL